MTWTSWIPDPAGEIAVSEPAPFTVTLVAGIPPKSTPVTPVKFDPDTVTEVPPVDTPADGEIDETTGSAAGAWTTVATTEVGLA